jgi:ribosomal protein S18 acetylase RimI-like enzyme
MTGKNQAWRTVEVYREVGKSGSFGARAEAIRGKELYNPGRRNGPEAMKMREIRLREGTNEDWEWCAGLMAGSEPWITLQQGEEACREKLGRAGHELFVADEADGGKKLGFVQVAPHGFAGAPYISAIAVEEKERGRGVGAAMLRLAEKRYAKHGRLFLLVSSFNGGAQEFYRREGYECLGELQDFVTAGQSEMIFKKALR